MTRRLPLECPRDLLPEARVRVANDRRARVVGLTASFRRWPEPWREAFEERAALMEFHGCLPRAQAERLAEVLVRTAFEEGDAPP